MKSKHAIFGAHHAQSCLCACESLELDFCSMLAGGWVVVVVVDELVARMHSLTHQPLVEWDYVIAE